MDILLRYWYNKKKGHESSITIIFSVSELSTKQLLLLSSYVLVVALQQEHTQYFPTLNTRSKKALLIYSQISLSTLLFV